MHLVRQMKMQSTPTTAISIKTVRKATIGTAMRAGEILKTAASPVTGDESLVSLVKAEELLPLVIGGVVLSSVVAAAVGRPIVYIQNMFGHVCSEY